MELTIDCRACIHRNTDTCDDCLVSFVASREPDEAVVIDAAEFAAMRRLAAAGLIESPLDGLTRHSERSDLSACSGHSDGSRHQGGSDHSEHSDQPRRGLRDAG